MATEIENLVISVESKGIDTTAQAINSLTNTLNKIQTASKSASSGASKAINTTTSGIKKLKFVFEQLAKSAKNSLKSGISSTIDGITKKLSFAAVSKALGNAIGYANDYVESLNLFSVAMGNYSKEAKEYATVVSDIMGIDVAEWERAQGTIMTLVTGFGTLESRAYTMSKNLTQLGYDLSSFFNISVGDAMAKIESGIAGELEPLRRLGYDLSQTKLQAVALELGIKKSVSAMTQAEKAELRYYAIMTQVTTAQGDMARTLDSPANQMRILTAQIKMLSTSLGTTFIPILNKVIPYLIAIVKVLRQMTQEIANIMGFELPNVDYSSVKNTSDYLSEADENANKLKKDLMGFDEINRLSGNDGGIVANGTGFGFDLPEYDFLGDVIKSKTDEIFDRIISKLGLIKGIIKSLIAVVAAVKFISWITSLLNFISKITGLKALINGLPNIASALGIGLALAGIGLLVKGIYDWYKAGEMTSQVFLEIVGAIALISAGIAILTKSPIAVFVGAILAGVIAIGKGIYDWVKGAELTTDIITSIVGGIALIGLGIAGILLLLAGGVPAAIAAVVTAVVALVTTAVLLIVKNWDAIKAKFSETKEKIISWWEDVKTSFKNMDWIDAIIEGIKNALGKIAGFFKGLKIGGKKVEVEAPNIEAKANGGYVNSGQLFIAREAGAEMVGSMNGHTAVANNDQITEGIYRAVLQAMRESGGGNNGGSTTFVAQLNGKTIFEEVVNENKKASRMYGRSPLTV